MGEQITEKRQELVNQMVNGLDINQKDNGKVTTPASASNAAPGVEDRRWWSEACMASHKAHSLDSDPVCGQPRSSAEDGGPEASRTSRGCLEVEILSFCTM